METVKDLLSEFSKLTKLEQESFIHMFDIRGIKVADINDLVAKERYANGYVYPLCESIHVVRNENGRTKCRDTYGGIAVSPL